MACELLQCERDPSGRHAVIRVQIFDRIKKASEVFAAHIANDIDICRENRGSLKKGSQPTAEHKIRLSLNQSAGDGFQIWHGFDSGLLEGLPLG